MRRVRHTNVAMQGGAQGEAGYTLIEVLASVTIFGIVAAIPLGFLNQSRYNDTSGERIGAVAAAQQQFDQLRVQDIDDLPNSGSETDSVTIGEIDYTVVTRFCVNGTYCNSPNNRHIRVEVYGKRKRLFAAETVFTQLR